MFGLTANPATQVSGGVQCRIWMLRPYNAKNAVSVACEIITRYAGGYAFIVYTAFGVSHFSEEDVRCVSHKETSG